MSDYQCQICTGTRGWHTSGCRQVSQELAALRARVAGLEAATPTLELVGGEWGISQNGKVTVRDVGEWTIWVRHRNNIFAWNVEKGCETCDTWIANGTAPTREAAIEAAEKALLVEVGKFVRVAGRQAEVTKRQDIAGSADTL